MKKSRSLITAGLTRCAVLVAVALGLSAVAANANPNVKVLLGGKSFGQQGGNSVDLHAQSDGFVDADSDYYYRITGKCHGTGDFANFVPPDTTIAELVNMIQEGAAKSLVGVKHNAGGKLPFPILNKTYHGTNSGFEFNITIKINITADGAVTFDVENVSVSGFISPNGTIEFDPGAQVQVGVAPIIKMATNTKQVDEDAGKVSITVKRTGNLGSVATVHYATAVGTARKADFAAKSGTLTFAVGEDTVKIPQGVKIKNDNLAESDEHFSVDLSKPTAALLGGPATTDVTILDDDAL